MVMLGLPRGIDLNRLRTAWIGALALALIGAVPVAATAQAARARGPLVVELFTAQGCDSCPQANTIVADLAERDSVIALTFPVDYWDYLGWRDTFARPEFSARQRAYAARLGVRAIYTPEVVINGRREASGVQAEVIQDLVTSEAARRVRLTRPSIQASRRGARVSVGSGSAFREPADVWLVRYDPIRRDVRVRSGDNEGKTVAHLNVVRDLVRLGSWNGRLRSYTLPASPAPGLHSVILVQGAKGGPILAARELDPR
jgi:hypothetical protein